MAEQQEGNNEKVSGGKVKIPSFLHDQQQRTPKPAWMKKLSESHHNAQVKVSPSPRAETAAPGSDFPPPPPPSPPSDTDSFGNDDVGESNLVLPNFIAGNARPEKKLGGTMDSSHHSVKDHVQALQVRTSMSAIAPADNTASADHQPAWLLTGSVPRAKQLEDENRTANRLLRELEVDDEGSRKSLSENLKTLQLLKQAKEEIDSAKDADKAHVQPEGGEHGQRENEGDANAAENEDMAPAELEVLELATDKDRDEQQALSATDPLETKAQKSGSSEGYLARAVEEDGEALQLGGEPPSRQQEADINVDAEMVEHVEEEVIEEVVVDSDSEEVEEIVEDESEVDDRKKKNEEPEDQEEEDGHWMPLHTSSAPVRHARAQALAEHPESYVASVATENDYNVPPRAEQFSVEREPMYVQPEELLQSPRSDRPSDEENEDVWMVPHRYDDDSSWVNPSRPIEPSRKKRISDDLMKKSVELSPSLSHDEWKAPLHPSEENQNREDQASQADRKLGLIVEHPGAGTVSEASLSDVSNRIIESSIPNRQLDAWAVPREGPTMYRGAGKLNSHLVGKDYRFSYIASQHTHSTASYADVVRERYFPKEDNEYWAAPAVDSTPELPLHISRDGLVKSGPSGETESWMPPEIVASDEPVDKAQYYVPTIAEENDKEQGRSVEIVGMEWAQSPKVETESRKARVDFSGSVEEESLDGSFEWNPRRDPTPPPSPETIPKALPHSLSKSLPSPPSRNFDAQQEEKLEEEVEEDQFNDSSPPRMHQDITIESAPDDPHHDRPKIEYSPSGRLMFDMTPQMIIIDNDVEHGRTQSRDNGTQECTQARIGYSLLCIFVVLIIPAVVVVVVLVALDGGSGDGNSGINNGGEPPTPTPSTPTKPIDGHSKPPSSTNLSGLVGHLKSGPSAIIEEDVLVDFLSQWSPDGGSALQLPDSPQYAAMQWIRTPANQGIVEDRIFLQRYALATLYFATGGGEWTTSDSWLTNNTECEWYTSSTLPHICDSDGNILELDLSNNHLKGHIPPELALLSNSLDDLLFARNQLESTIPPALGNLAHLRGLDLGSNELSGVLPDELGLLSELEYLSLHSNNFSGTIPAFLGTIGLKELYMDDNSFGPVLPNGFCENAYDQFWADCSEIGGCSCCTKCCQDDVGCS